MKRIFKVMMLVMLSLFFVSCGSSSDGGSNASTSQLIIGHSGVDFSKDMVEDVDWKDQDGYTTAWSPTAYVEGEEWGSGMWYSNNVQDNTATYYYMQNLGNVSLDSIKSVDTTAWPAYAAAMHSLEVGNVYVIKVQDGYVKFKVLSVASSDEEWAFTADYQYSISTSF